MARILDPYDAEQAPATGDDRLVDWIGIPPKQRLWLQARPYVRGGSLLLVAAMLLALVVSQRTDDAALAVGDCLNAPPSSGLVETLTPVSCTDPHNAEVFDVLDYVAGEFPGDTALLRWATGQCQGRVEAYTGEPWTETPAWVNALVPTDQSWSQGDRTVACLLVPAPGDPLLTESLRR